LPFTQDGSAGVVGSEQSNKRAGVSYHFNWFGPKQNLCTYSEVGIEEGRQKKGWAGKGQLNEFIKPRMALLVCCIYGLKAHFCSIY